MSQIALTIMGSALVVVGALTMVSDISVIGLVMLMSLWMLGIPEPSDQPQQSVEWNYEPK